MKPFRRGTLPNADQLPPHMHDDAVWLNDKYQVNERIEKHPTLGRIKVLSIKRRDREPIHDWRELQHIKNCIAGREIDAVEIYPKESKLVDTANQYWLWCFLDTELPFGFRERLVGERSSSVFDGMPSKQRKFADHVRPADLAECEAKLDQYEADLKRQMK